MINKISLDLTKNIPTRPALIFGMENENNSSFLEIKLPYSLVDKWLYIEFSISEREPFTTPRLTAQDIDGNAILIYEIGNSITQYLGFGKIQVVAKNASGLVWKSSEVDYIIKNSINATEQIVESKPDVIADLQRQINEIGGGGGSTPSGSNSSGIYVVTQDLALQGTSSTPLDSVLVGEKELQVGDILTDNKGTIAKVSSIEETTITSGGSVGEGTIVVANYEVVSNQEIPQEVWEGINEARAIAEGRNKAVTFYDLTAMVVELPTYGNTILKIGDNLYIKQTNVPDYWVSEVYDTFVEYTYISDEQTILDINNGIQIGYYGLAVLETNKVEVSNNYTDLENKPSINGVELSGNKTSADLKLGLVSPYGGFSAGTDASATGYGGAVGYKANSADGGAVGGNATAYNGGGAVGKSAKADYGGAVGFDTETYYGGAIGMYAKAYDGFAGGPSANSRFAPNGTTKVNGAVAVGKNAKARANNAIQLGTGINDEENTMKVGDYKLLNANGKIPTERLPEISGGGSNSSGIYYTPNTLSSNVDTSNPYIELNGKTLQVGDMLINKSGVTARITEILSVGEQPLKVGDTIVELYANPNITPDFEAFDWSGAEVYENAESIFNGMSYITLFNTTNGSKLVAGMLDSDGSTQYALIFMESNVTPSVSSIIYSILMGGFVDVYTINEVTISEVYQQDIWGQYIYKTSRRSDVGYEIISRPYHLLNKGQEVEGLVFNSKISVSKMNEYLASLAYGSNTYILLSLRNGGGGGSLRYEIKAINLTTLGQSLSVSADGYAVGVYDFTLDRIVKLLYLSNYSQENVGIVEQLLATDYTPTITSAGWIDTSYLHAYCQIDPYTDIDFAVNAFIATNRRYWEVFEMFDNGTELKEFTYTATNPYSALRLFRIFTKAKGAVRVQDMSKSGEFYLNVDIGNNYIDSSSTLKITLSRVSITATSYIINTYFLSRDMGGTYSAKSQVISMKFATDTEEATNTYYETTVSSLNLKVTYYNDVEIV